MERFTELINALDGWLWGLPMIVLLLSGVIAKEKKGSFSTVAACVMKAVML